jgi:hypothetical protein
MRSLISSAMYARRGFTSVRGRSRRRSARYRASPASAANRRLALPRQASRPCPLGMNQRGRAVRASRDRLDCRLSHQVSARCKSEQGGIARDTDVQHRCAGAWVWRTAFVNQITHAGDARIGAGHGVGSGCEKHTFIGGQQLSPTGLSSVNRRSDEPYLRTNDHRRNL